MRDTIEFLVARGIPVMGHVGLMPQSFNAMGGYRIQGRDERGASEVLRDARAVAEAGAFSIVIEGTAEPVARAITQAVRVPTIGIGASADCDGQVLVTEDMLGLFAAFKPSFVKRYAELGHEVERAVEAYARDVRARKFPGPEHVFQAPSNAPAKS
jgi:3-methyl-2-oxobutanoate hydroxymethyltransferase